MNKEIYSSIKDKILWMEYKPGQILNEQVLAKEFGVSRTPLREVLTRLEWENLVRILPRTGSMVTEIDFQSMVNIFRIRFELEALAGKLAAENITNENLDEIKAIQVECKELTQEMDQKQLVGVDKQLRRVIYDAANNPKLTEISDSLYALTQRLWGVLFIRGKWKDEVKAMIEEIEQTHEALSEGDPEKAGKVRRQWLNEHVDRIKGRL